MKARVRVLALALALAACKKPSQNGTTGSASAPPPLPPPSASVSVTAPTKPVAARACHVGPKVTVSEGRGGVTHSIAASARGVVVTWGELRAPAPGFGPEDGKQRYEMARVLDPKTLAPLPAGAVATVVGQQEAVDAFSNGIAPFALADGTLGTATCAWAAFAGHLTCGMAAAPGSTFSGASYDDPGVAGPGPEGDRIAATGVADAAILVLPQCQDVRIVSSAGKPGLRPLAYGTAEGRTACAPKQSIDVPALAAIGGSDALGVWRHGKAIEGRVIARDGAPTGAVLTFSGAGGDVGAPAIAWTGSDAVVLYAARTGSAPYALASARWKSGAPITRATIATGAAPAMAPALVATDEPACVLASWTEGQGSTTHVRAGIVCNDALVATSVVDVSATGVEAGDSELARMGIASSAYVVWQELPKGKPAELVVATIACE